jgi:hypothetical protein
MADLVRRTVRECPELGGVCVEVEDGSRFSAIAGI